MSSNTFEMCRCCGIFELPKPQKLIPFFGPGKHENLIVNIKNVITSCWEVQIAENDGHPQHICPKCFSTFDAYFSLRGFCRRNQNHLNDVFRKKTTNQIAKCRVYEETDENNREINTEEDTANKSLTCNKNKQAKTGTKFLNAPENQNNDTEVKETKWKCIEFVEMPITIFKKQRQIKDGVVHCKRNGHDDQKLNNQLIEEPEYEGDVQYLENSDELNNPEILEQLNCNKETDHGNYTTLIKQVFQMETDCEIVVESEISQPEFNQFDDIDSLEYENTVSTDDKGYEENIIYQSETDKNRQNENPLECKYCRFDTDLTPNGIEFKSKEKLDAHIKVQHVSPRPYTCIICKKNFVSLYNCKQHIKFVHKKKKTICWICGLHFGHLKQHVERCHTVADFECETCGKKFKNVSPNIFRYHKRWHSKTYRYKCTYCGKIFIQSTHLRTHILTRHTRNFTIKCLKCGKGFSSQFCKAMHMYRIHGDALPVKCLYCDARFPQYQKRIAHMLEIHGHVHVNDEKYKCLKCNKVFRREYNLEKHMESGCEKGTWKDNKTINKGYTPAPKIKKYSCQECGRLFGKKSALLMHIPLHSKKGRPFQCNVCQLHYKTNSHLYSHKRLKHSNEKPFACDICGKKFALNYMLTEHKSFHKAKLEKAFKID